MTGPAAAPLRAAIGGSTSSAARRRAGAPAVQEASTLMKAGLTPLAYTSVFNMLIPVSRVLRSLSYARGARPGGPPSPRTAR